MTFKKKVINYISIVLFFLLFSNCSHIGKLSIPYESYKGNNLKFNGFYCNVNNKNDLKVIYYFFENGLIYGESTTDYKKAFQYTPEHFNNCYRLPYCWSVYNVEENNKLIIEGWISNIYYSTHKFTGEIINDTTIILNHLSKSVGRDTFYYFTSECKPDSSKISFSIK